MKQYKIYNENEKYKYGLVYDDEDRSNSLYMVELDGLKAVDIYGCDVDDFCSYQIYIDENDFADWYDRLDEATDEEEQATRQAIASYFGY